MNWIYLNNTNHIICYQFFSWLPYETHELPFSVPLDLGLTCLQHGSSEEPIPSASYEAAVETVLNVTLNQDILSRCSVQLPHDCDSSHAITLSLNGIALPQHSFWEVIETSYPNNDLIAWNGLELQHLAQLDDCLIISYYRRLSL